MNDLEMTIELRLMNRGNLKAFADITFPSALGEITVRGFRVVQKEGQEPWVAFPSSSYTKDGKIVNNPILEVSRGLKQKVTVAVLTRYKDALQGV